MPGNTKIDIAGDAFHLNGAPTFTGRSFRGHNIEGLLPNARLIQGIFDDLNPATRDRWNYPDGPWNPDRNTDAFVAAMPEWRAHGLLAFTLGLQGGSPEGYSMEQPWHNSAFTADGTPRPDYLSRLARILDAADRHGMVAILSLFYFGQDQRLNDEGAIRNAIRKVVDWLCERGDTNILIEIANEAGCETYSHDCFGVDRIHELIALAQEASAGRVGNALGHFPVGASFLGGVVPPPEVARVSDLILLHGNDLNDPEQIREMIRGVRSMDAYRGQPIVINEDDHFSFDQADNNFLAATGERTSWGYFDYRMAGEKDFHDGYQSMPCDWGIGSERKRAFFELLRAMTGAG